MPRGGNDRYESEVPDAQSMTDWVLHRLRARAHVTGEERTTFARDRINVSILTTQVGQARNAALEGFRREDRPWVREQSPDGLLYESWSGSRLAAFAAYFILCNHTPYFTGQIPPRHVTDLQSFGDQAPPSIGYLQVVALDLIDMVVFETDDVDLDEAVSTLPKSVLRERIDSLVKSLNDIVAGKPAVDAVPLLQRRIEELRTGAPLPARLLSFAPRRLALILRTIQQSALGKVAALAIAAVAGGLLTYNVEGLAQTHIVPSPSAEVTQEASGTDPVIMNVLELVEATTQDGQHARASPWSTEVDPIVLEVNNSGRSKVTISVNLRLAAPQEEDLTVHLSLHRPGGLDYEVDRTFEVKGTQIPRLRPTPTEPEQGKPPTAALIPVTLAADGTATTYSTELTLRELQSGEVVTLSDSSRPSTAVLFRCGLTGLPFNVLITGPESNGVFVNVPVPLFVLKRC